MKSRTRFVSILAGVCVLGLNVVPAIADSGAARDSPSVQFAFASGESLTTVLDRALERTDRGTLTQVLSSLSDAAANGESINFPGLEDETSEEVSRLLDGASGAIEKGSSYPNELSRIEVAPAATPSVVNDPYDSALSSDSVAPLAIESEPLWPSDYEAFGSAINDNRTWAWTTVYEIRDCPPIGACTTFDKLSIDTLIDPGRSSTRVTHKKLYSPNSGNLSSTPSFNTKVFVPHDGAYSGEEDYSMAANSNFFYIPHADSRNKRMIIGVKETVIAFGSSVMGLANRSLTATCDNDALPTCAWYV